jgi:chromosome segregation ATPase
MTGHDPNDYISEAEAASILHRSERQVRRYARTEKVMSEEIAGVRMYLRRDVEALAAELRERDRTRPARSELVPMGDVLEHLARKDDEIRDLNERLQRAMLEIGRLQGQNEAQQRLLTTGDSDQTRPEDDRTGPNMAGHGQEQVRVLEAERDRYKAEVERLRRRNFWQWLLGR